MSDTSGGEGHEDKSHSEREAESEVERESSAFGAGRLASTFSTEGASAAAHSRGRSACGPRGRVLRFSARVRERGGVG